MNEIVMNSVEKQIFRTIYSGKFIRRDLIKFIKEREICSSATLDRTLVKFINWDLVVKGKKEGEYLLTKKGDEYNKSIEVKPDLPFRYSGLKKVIDKLPTEAHRGLVYFILATITAKQYLWDNFPDCWPSFIIGGETGDIKTLLASIVCAALGLNPVRHIQNVIPKTEKQVLGITYQVKGEHGKRLLNPAEYFGYLLICWDELDKVTNKAVWRALMFYLDGKREFEERDTIVKNRVVCLVTMNFETVKLLIPKPYLRRAFVVDSKALRTDPKETEEIGTDIMSKPIPRIKIDNLPVAFRKLEKADKDLMRDLIYNGLVSREEGRVIDTNFLEKVVLGWLILQQSGDVKDAIYWAAEKALCFLQTQGRTKEGWREELIQAWGNYRVGKDREFDKAWEEKLKQVKEDEARVKFIKAKDKKVGIDKGIEERHILANYVPKLDRLREIKAGFTKMNGGKHRTVLLYLNLDIKKFTQKLPTEKRDNKVTSETLTEIELSVEDWEGNYKSKCEAWEAEQARLKKAREEKEEYCRYLAKLKGVLKGFKGKDLGGVLWSTRIKFVIADIGLVLDKKTQTKYYNKSFLDAIHTEARSLLTEYKELPGEIKRAEIEKEKLREKEKIQQDILKRKKEAEKEREKREEEEKKDNVKREQELNRKIQAIKKKKNELSEKLAKPLTWRDYDDVERLEKKQIKSYLNRKEFDKRTISNMFTLAKKYLRKMDFDEKYSYPQKLPFEEQLKWSFFDDWYLASGKTYLLENIKLMDLKEILTGRIKEIDDERKTKLIEQRDALGKEEESLKLPLCYIRTNRRLVWVKYLGEKEDQRLHFELEDGAVWMLSKGRGWTIQMKIEYGSESFPFISEEGSTIVVQTNEGRREISEDRIFCYIYEYRGPEPS